MHPDAGICLIWYGSQNNLSDRQGIVSHGQIMFMWRDFEPTEGNYNFQELDNRLKAVRDKGMKTTVQINGNLHPDYIFETVPYLAGKDYNGQKDHTIGYGPPMYWHAAYKAKYENMIKALAEHLLQSQYREAVLGIRQNYCAVGTENYFIEAIDRDQSNWTRKSTATWGGPWPWTTDIGKSYKQWAMDMFIRHFNPPDGLPVFIRANAVSGGIVTNAQKEMVSNGQLMLFHTSSEPQPRNSGKNSQYQVFVDYCKTGKTWGFMESWSAAKTSSTGWDWANTATTISLEQFNYWTLLVDLHCGASFPAMRPEDIDKPSFKTDYEFAAKYAGYHHSPEQSPGAWIAFREGDYLAGDYTFLMKRIGSDNSTPLYNIDNTRYGLWARKATAGSKISLELDSTFASSLVGNTGVKLRIWYKDGGNGTFNITAFGQTFTDTKANSGNWKLAEHSMNVTKHNASISIQPADNDVILHMVEILRGTATSANRAKRIFRAYSEAKPNAQAIEYFDLRGRRMHFSTFSRMPCKPAIIGSVWGRTMKLSHKPLTYK
jgi:hypothetical protein